jgi:hypothetical protein
MADKKVEAITSMEEDFAQWYTDVVVKADLTGYTSVKGFMVLKPAGYAIWELIQNQLDAKFKETGVENVYLPMLIPVTEEITKCKSLQKEKAFKMLIDLETGHILNWEQGYAMKIYWKIVDQGVYEYRDSNMNIIEKLDTDYCPNFLL